MTRIGEAERDSLSGSARMRPPTRLEHLGALAAMIFIAALASLRSAELDGDVLALDLAQVAQLLAERINEMALEGR
jgi:hypothetical protein